MRKGQVTFFLLFALVLLVLFAVLFFLGTIGKESETKKTIQKTALDAATQQTIKNMVTTCLREKASEGLYLLGRQGGFFHETQEGATLTWEIPTIAFQGNNVSLLVQPPDFENIVMPPPYYPCFHPSPYVSDTLEKDECAKTYSHDAMSYLFGKVGEPVRGLLPDLCDESRIVGSYTCPCKKCALPYSIEEQLENYVSSQIFTCLDFASFESYNITVPKATTNVTFAVDTVQFTLNLPLSIRPYAFKGQAPEIKVESYFVSLPVRLLPIYSLIHGAGGIKSTLQQDIVDINYSLVREMQTIANREYSFLKIERMPAEDAYVVRITDEDARHELAGKPFVFQFAVANRLPALDYLSHLPEDDYDVVVVEGQLINLTPIAFDPDEDQLIVSYGGWKVDWDDIYHSTRCDNTSLPYQEKRVPYAGANVWQTSPEYREGCPHPFYGSVTATCASYKPVCADIGEHMLTVRVTDTHGETDYQNLTILVDDKPRAFFTAYPLFPMTVIPRFFASTEDPYVLDGTASGNIIGGELEYEWKVTDAGGVEIITKSFAPARDTLRVSGFPPYDIKDEPEVNDFKTPGQYTAKLTVRDADNNLLTDDVEHAITVADCLPHRAPYAAYPQNSIAGDGIPDIANPFLANHSCCLGDPARPATWRLATPADKISCYEYLDYGTLGTFEASPSSGLPVSGTYALEVLAPGDDSDVYVRRFARFCDGKRGNICQGESKLTVTKHLTCPAQGKHELCSVAKDGFDSCQLQPEGTFCQKFTGTGECLGCDVQGECTIPIACP